MKKITRTAYEADCLARAEYFTAVRGFGRNRTRKDCASLAEARAEAATYGDGRTMIYAVTNDGLTAHVENA